MDQENIGSLHDLVHRAREEQLANMPKLPFSAALLLSLYVCICMAYLPLWRSPVFATVVLMLSAIMVSLTLRSFWVIGMLTVPTVLLAGVTGSVSVAAFPVALLCGIAYGAFLMLNARVPIAVATVLAAMAFGVSLTGEVLPALSAIVGVPAMLTLAYCLRRGHLRVRTICCVSVALALSLSVLGIGYIWYCHGVEAFLEPSRAVDAARGALANRLAAWETGTGENTGRVVLEGMELALAGAVFNILPGVLLALTVIFSYMIDLVCLTLFRTYERAKYLSSRVFVVAISLPAAVMFLAVCLLLLMLGERGDMGAQFAAVVAENIYLIFLPAMCLAGAIQCLRAFLLSAHRGLLLIGAILLVAISPSLALTVLPLLGAFDVIRRAFLHWLVRRRHPD